MSVVQVFVSSAAAPTDWDGFTHRPNRPWHRAPRFSGPRATNFSMTTQC